MTSTHHTGYTVKDPELTRRLKALAQGASARPKYTELVREHLEEIEGALRGRASLKDVLATLNHDLDGDAMGMNTFKAALKRTRAERRVAEPAQGSATDATRKMPSELFGISKSASMPTSTSAPGTPPEPVPAPVQERRRSASELLVPNYVSGMPKKRS